MTEVNVDHRLVQIHYSKLINEEEGFEYTDEKYEANLVAVYLETRFKDENGKEISEFDITHEKEFDIDELNHDQAVEQAEQYASELAIEYKTDWEWY